VFHWLLAASFIGAFVTAESERWRLVHVTLGYTVGGLVLFPAAVGPGGHQARPLCRLRARPARGGRLPAQPAVGPGRSTRWATTPPARWPSWACWAARLLLVGSGWATYNDLGPGWLEDLHEGLGNGLLALVVVHVLGVIVSSRLHGENLVRAMVTGHKQGTPDEGIRHAWRSLAVLMLAAVLGFWGWQYNQAPDASTLADQAQTQLAERPRHGHHGDRQITTDNPRHAHPAGRRRHPAGRWPAGRSAAAGFPGRLGARWRGRRT
jgi:cytochrome b